METNDQSIIVLILVAWWRCLTYWPPCVHWRPLGGAVSFPVGRCFQCWDLGLEREFAVERHLPSLPPAITLPLERVTRGEKPRQTIHKNRASWATISSITVDSQLISIHKSTIDHLLHHTIILLRDTEENSYDSGSSVAALFMSRQRRKQSNFQAWKDELCESDYLGKI